MPSELDAHAPVVLLLIDISLAEREREREKVVLTWVTCVLTGDEAQHMCA